MKKYIREKILGVEIDNLSEEDIWRTIDVFLGDGKFHQIATVNPEFILSAQRHQEFREILNRCDLNIADSFGLRFAFWRKGKKMRSRLTGADLMMRLLQIADEKRIPIYLAADRDGLSSWEETKSSLLSVHPNLEIEGANFVHDSGEKPLIEGKYIIFCNFGHLFQERFLNGLNDDIIGIAVGVGGSFDFITGKIVRAPLWMRKAGFEWLWRLLQQPQRLPRIFRATVVFPIKVLFMNNTN